MTTNSQVTDFWAGLLKLSPDSPDHKSEAKVFALDNLGVLTVSGLDAATFLQGQVTVDVESMADGTGAMAGHCDHKGRLNSNFFLLRNSQTDFSLVLHQDVAEFAQQALAKYAVFSKCEVTNDSDSLAVIACDDPEALDSLVVSCKTADTDCNPSNLGSLISPASESVDVNNSNLLLLIDVANLQNPGKLIEALSEFNFANSQQWAQRRICAGVALLKAGQLSKHIPQMLNMDQLGAISWTKGCYTGQEVVARLHYRGSSNRRLFLFELCNITATDFADFLSSAEQATILNEEGKAIGDIVDWSTGDPNTYTGLAVVKLREALKLTASHSSDERNTLQGMALQCAVGFQDEKLPARLLAPPYISMEELLNVSEQDSKPQ